MLRFLILETLGTPAERPTEDGDQAFLWTLVPSEEDPILAIRKGFREKWAVWDQGGGRIEATIQWNLIGCSM